VEFLASGLLNLLATFPARMVPGKQAQADIAANDN
jgi:hypothetical protein